MHRTGRSITDWSYRAARGRLIRAAGRHLPNHTASGRLDDAGNRIVDCRCGWSGNALGWDGHLDHIVRAALDGDRADD